MRSIEAENLIRSSRLAKSKGWTSTETHVHPYETSHPWLTFQLDLRRASPGLWMLLGEAQSKCEHIAGIPLQPATADRLHRLYLAKGVRATTAIEGNTLSEEQVLQHLSGQLELPLSKQYLQREIDNVITACNEITARLLKGDDHRVTPALLSHWNERVLADLPLEAEVVPGRIRGHPVTVGRYLGAPAEDCKYLLERLCTWLAHFEGDIIPGASAGTGRTAAALLQAILGHLYLAWIHPFADGNGRTARLLEFHLLVAAGLPTPAAHLLSNHYNETRAEYYRQLDQASRSGGDVFPFLEYALEGFVDGLRAQLQEIREQQWEIAWENYVHDTFAARKTATDLRQRDLLLDLAKRREPVALAEIPELSPRLARAYADRTRKTLSRDVNALVAAGLVERLPAGVRAKREIVLAFLPRRRQAGAAPEGGGAK
jgi:Fic family protein